MTETLGDGDDVNAGGDQPRRAGVPQMVERHDRHLRRLELPLERMGRRVRSPRREPCRRGTAEDEPAQVGDRLGVLTLANLRGDADRGFLWRLLATMAARAEQAEPEYLARLVAKLMERVKVVTKRGTLNLPIVDALRLLAEADLSGIDLEAFAAGIEDGDESSRYD